MIIKMYAVSGMRCDGCVTKVKSAIKGIPEVIEAQVHLTTPEAIISMREEVPVARLREVVSAAGNYEITEIEEKTASELAAHPNKGSVNKMLGFLHHKKDCCK